MSVVRCACCFGFLLWYGAVLSGQQISTELIYEWRSTSLHAKGLRELGSGRRIADQVFLATYPDAQTAATALNQLRVHPDVRAVQYNFQVEFRKTPNDPDYFRQLNMQRAGFEAAWDVTTGGVTAEGHAIVTAVLDGGFDTDHEDLVENIWTNAVEVPNDGLDNDGNGYIDDLNGWNFVGSSPEHPSDTHGTAVAGLLGARGNNSLGVAGTNWDARLMLFTISTVADIISAYQYVIDLRASFNRSGGTEGAFVVSTNASFGIEGATCEEFPVWGAMYDRLGEVGVLTAASVANVDRDADRAGDMPVDCPSDFLIGVTNVDDDDGLFPSSGYGRTNVDLAAPGERSYTTRPNNGYGSFGSTSAAAPYVTGAVSLLYSLTTCTDLLRASRSDPARVARRMRETILASVRPGRDLADRTVTGGIIAVGAAVNLLQASCAPQPQQLAIQKIYPNPSAGTVKVQTNQRTLPADLKIRLIDVLGRAARIPGYRQATGEPGTLIVDLSGMAAGVYTLVVEHGGRTAFTKLILL